MNSENMYTTNNQSTSVLRRWRKNGDVTDIPRAVQTQGYNWLGSDRFVEDASFLRMRTLTVNYDFTSKRVNDWGIKTLKAFITGYNLFTFSNYTGQDPEVGFNGSDPFAIGFDYSRTPPPVNITMGINIVF
jgi:hypothetical protein